MIVHKNKNGKPACGTWSRFPYLESDFLKSKGFQVNCKKCLGKTNRTVKAVEIQENLVGKIFRSSFGYNMTINEFAKVIKQSDKSILLQECWANVENDHGHGNGTATAGGLKPDGKTFRLIKKKRDYGDGRGHEYWAGGVHSSQCWGEWDGKPHYHNTWD